MTPAPDDRPVYGWQPTAGPEAWRPPPAPAAVTAPPLPRSPTAPSAADERRTLGPGRGIIGGILAALAALFKYGVILLKVGKLAPTLLTMIIAIWFYTLFFGPAFAIGLAVLVLVHELGHYVVARSVGIPAALPIFLGPIGAVTRLRRPPVDPEQGGVIAIAGPAFGTAAAFACFILAEAAAPGYSRYLLLALAYFGCFLSVLNLIPMGFLDGAKVANGIPLWTSIVGLTIVAAVVLFLGNPIALIFLIIGIISTVQRARRQGQPGSPPRTPTSLWLGITYIALIGLSAAGMSIAQTAIINSNFVPGVTQSSGSV